MRSWRLLVSLAVCIGSIGTELAVAQTRVEGTEGEKASAEEKAAEDQLKRAQQLVAQSGPIDPARYVLGPGDVLELDLWGAFSRSTFLTVSPEGTVFLFSSGPVDVAGHTLSWARERILRMVGESFRGVRADLRLIQLRSFKVYLAGAVKTPGPISVTSVTRASEAVGDGLAAGASRRNIEIRHRDGSRARLDLELFEATGSQRWDPVLVDGDVIVVPLAREWIGALGGVARSGRFEYAPGDSVGTLLRLSGGLVPSSAAERALMVRFTSPSDRESVWVNLEEVGSGRGDFALRDGDQLFVSMRAGFHQLPAVTIYGEVERPGTFPIVLGRDRFSDMIRWAGGFRTFANRSSIFLIRDTGTQREIDPEFDRLVRLSRAEMTESEYTKFQTRLAERKNSFRLDWSRVQSGGSDADPLLQPGDLVRVEQLVSTVRIEGQVRRPGFVDYVQGRPLSEYVKLSGGFTDRAARRDVSVSRLVTGQVIPARSLQAVLPGDFVWVPERRDVDAWAVFRDVVTVAGQLALLIFTLSR